MELTSVFSSASLDWQHNKKGYTGSLIPGTLTNLFQWTWSVTHWGKTWHISLCVRGNCSDEGNFLATCGSQGLCACNLFMLQGGNDTCVLIQKSCSSKATHSLNKPWQSQKDKTGICGILWSWHHLSCEGMTGNKHWSFWGKLDL